ncbi:MAG: PD-(D/E)XK nuclease family protein [Thermoanaerobacteraceae bacterium]|nr:PD-(D/E)XK nuclease family protein [Thermoanaerobacteraceae bacterium]
MNLYVLPTKELMDRYMVGCNPAEDRFETFDGFVWKCIYKALKGKREIDNNEKTFILYRIMESAGLNYFKVIRWGYVIDVSRVIGELKLQGITMDKICQLPMYSPAWPDLVNIFHQYQNFLSDQGFYDKEDRFIICRGNIRTNKYIEGFDKIIFRDFYYFTSVQREIINLLGDKAGIINTVLNDRAKVKVVKARDIYAECYGLADNIINDISNGFSYGDVAVVTRDDSYKRYVYDSFKTRGIPVGFELQAPILSNPFVKNTIKGINGGDDTIVEWVERLKSSISSAEGLAQNHKHLKNLRRDLEARKTFLSVLDGILFVEERMPDKKLISQEGFKKHITSILKGITYREGMGSGGVRIYSPLDIRGLNFKRVYLVGAYEGSYPRTFIGDWLIKDVDRAQINSLGYTLDTIESLIERENLSWNFLKSTSDEIIASYPILGPGDSPTLPSWFLNQPDIKQTLELREVFPVNPVELKDQNGLKIDGISRTSFSVSELNEYGQCPYRYYLKNVLKLVPERENAFDSITIGSIYHEVLKQFYLKLPDGIEGDHREEYLKEIEKILSEVYDSHTAGFFESEAERRLYKDIMGDKLRDFLNSEIDKNYSRTLVEVEYPIELNLDGITISGRIDRLDKTDRGYLIIDYKKGYVPTIDEAAGGLDIQLPVYIMAIENQFIATSGGMYLSIEQKKREPIILKDMGTFGFSSRKKGLLTGDEWGIFFDEIKDIILGYVDGIRNGEFPLSPKKCPKTDGYGAYCEYDDICKYRGGE